MLFENVELLLPDGPPRPGSLRVEAGLIRESTLGGRLKPGPGEVIIDGRGGYLAPGFLDLHVHGACRRDAMEATEDAFAAILDFQASGGTTALALTSVASPLADLRRLLAAVRSANVAP